MAKSNQLAFVLAVAFTVSACGQIATNTLATAPVAPDAAITAIAPLADDAVPVIGIATTVKGPVLPLPSSKNQPKADVPKTDAPKADATKNLAMSELQAKFPRAGLPATMVGTTIDDALAKDTRLTPDQLLTKVAALGMNTVRLGAYWDEIQASGPGSTDFSKLDALLAAAQNHGVRVVLSVGAKGPNWPEYHVPAWATPKPNWFGDASSDKTFQDRAAAFTTLVAKHEADNPAICMWQVENEPLDSSGPHHWHLSAAMVAREAEILRQADGHRRPAMINCWSDGDRHPMIDQAFQIADVVGLDVYGNTGGGTGGADERTKAVPAYAMRKAQETGKPAMIAELQADNWSNYHANPKDVTALTHQLEGMGYENVLFWRLDQNVANNRQGDTSLDTAEKQLSNEALGH